MANSDATPIFGAGAVEMADLSPLVGRNISRLVASRLGGDIPEPGSHYLIAMTLMVDRAAQMYEDARIAFSAVAAAQGEEFPIHTLTRGSHCIEIAMGAILRAHLLGERLRRIRDMPRIAPTELLSSAEVRRIRTMRHFAEHLDERIVEGDVGERGRSSLMVRPTAQGIEFAGEGATYVEMGQWITRLERLARRLLQ